MIEPISGETVRAVTSTVPSRKAIELAVAGAGRGEAKTAVKAVKAAMNPKTRMIA